MRIALSALLLSLAAAAAPRPPPPNFPITPAQRDAVVRETVAKLQSDYVFPDRLQTYLPQLQARWSSADFQRISDAWALAERMNRDFADVVHDKHLGLKLAGAVPPAFFEDPDATPPPDVAARLEELDRQNGFGIASVELLEDGIGYLRIDGFVGKSKGESAAYAEAMRKLAPSRALIIDVRQNGGGDGETVADLVGYLLDRRTLLQDDITRAGKPIGHYSAEKVEGPRYGQKRPVYVLISPRTASAAEECAYDLQTQKRATIVGEPSAGGANHNRFFRVGDGFALSVPYMTTRNAVTGTNWEGKGVQPDVKVPANDALEEAKRLAAKAVRVSSG